MHDVVQAFAAYIPAAVSLSTCSPVLQYFQCFFWSLLVIVINVVTIIASLRKSFIFNKKLPIHATCLKYIFLAMDDLEYIIHSSYHNYQWGRPFTISLINITGKIINY